MRTLPPLHLPVNPPDVLGLYTTLDETILRIVTDARSVGLPPDEEGMAKIDLCSELQVEIVRQLLQRIANPDTTNPLPVGSTESDD